MVLKNVFVLLISKFLILVCLFMNNTLKEAKNKIKYG